MAGLPVGASVDANGTYWLGGRADPYKSAWSRLGPVDRGEQTTGSQDAEQDAFGSAIFSPVDWKSLGYSGPVSAVDGQGENASSAYASPELIKWMRENGYSMGTSPSGSGAVLGFDGKPVPGSAFGNRTNDDAAFYFGSLMLGGAGAYANSMGIGVDAAGNATGGAFGSGAGGSAAPATTGGESSTLGNWSDWKLDTNALSSGGSKVADASWLDYFKTGAQLYGAYQNYKAIGAAGDAAERAQQLQAEIAMNQQAMAREQWDNYLTKVQPGILEDTQFARERAKATAGQADRLFNDQMDDAAFYRGRYRNTQMPLEDEIISNARRLGSADEQDRLSGLAMADTRGAYADMRAMAERASARQGLNPASAAARAMAEEAFQNEALAAASNGTKSRFAAMDRYRSGLTDAAALGRGLPGFSSSASGGAGSAGGLTLQASTAPLQASGLGADVTNRAATTVNNMWGSASNTVNNSYNVASNYASLVNNGMYGTLAGYGFGRMQNGGP